MSVSLSGWRSRLERPPEAAYSAMISSRDAPLALPRPQDRLDRIVIGVSARPCRRDLEAVTDVHGGAVPDERNRVADGDGPTLVIAQRELESRETTVERPPERAEPLALTQKVRPGGAMQRLDEHLG